MAGFNYVREQLRVAVLGLAAGEAPLGVRIGEVYARELFYLEAQELPDDIRADFGRLSAAMSRGRPVGAEGIIAASARALTEREARDFAESIVSMYDRVAKYGPNG